MNRTITQMNALQQAQQAQNSLLNNSGVAYGALGGSNFTNQLGDPSSFITQRSRKKPSKTKQLYNDICGIYQIYRHISPKQTWETTWLSKRYCKAIQRAVSVSEVVYMMNDLNKCDRLQERAYNKLMDACKIKRTLILREQGFVG